MFLYVDEALRYSVPPPRLYSTTNARGGGASLAPVVLGFRVSDPTLGLVRLVLKLDFEFPIPIQEFLFAYSWLLSLCSKKDRAGVGLIQSRNLLLVLCIVSHAKGN